MNVQLRAGVRHTTTAKKLLELHDMRLQWPQREARQMYVEWPTTGAKKMYRMSHKQKKTGAE